MGRYPLNSGWSSFKHQWWAVIVLMMLGALAGLGLHQLRPETYRASATLVVGIDFVRTAAISETEIANIIGLVGDQVSSTSVVEETVQRAQAEGIEVDTAGLHAAGSAIRQNHVWLIEVRHPDPVVSARLANLWAENAYAQLDSLMVHSVLADNLAAAINAMQSCYELMPVLPAHAYCNPENLPNLQSMMLDLTRQLEAARQASGQIPSTASVAIGRQALTPLTPEDDYRNLYLFVGALVGLGSALVLLGKTWAQPRI
jgi:hypothetical protein